MTTMIRPRYYLDSLYFDNVTDRLRPGAPSHVRREFNRYQRIETFVRSEPSRSARSEGGKSDRSHRGH
jgi:hypothetical protein